MAEHGFVVGGRQFRTQTDYQLALKDQEIIDKLKKRIDFSKYEEVERLCADIEGERIRFRTILGTDFVEETQEILHTLEKQRNESQDLRKGKKDKKTVKSAKKNHTGNNTRSNQRKAQDLKKQEKRRNAGAQKKDSVSFDELDPVLQKEVLAELKRQDRRRKLIVFTCFFLAVGCFGYLFTYNYFIQRTESTYSQWADMRESADTRKEVIEQATVSVVEESTDKPPILEKYKTLYNKNKSLIGWLKIDDNYINYPVMQTTNNEYYLDHNLEQQYDRNGSIFMDTACDVLKPSTNFIIYGHHMKSGAMFGKLDLYSKESFYKEHPTLTFDTIYEEGTYEIMYVFRSRIYSAEEITFKYYQFIEAYSAEEFYSYMDEMAAMSLYDTGVTAEYGDQLLTLSTCDNSEQDGRFVVVAKKVK